MAPPLAASQHDLIDAIIKNNLPNTLIAKTANCHERTVRRRQSKQCSTATQKPRGQRRLITPYIDHILREQLASEPGLLQREMADFLYKKTRVKVSLSNLNQSLKAMGWSRKISRQVARQRNQELQDLYIHKLSEFKTNQLVFINESGCNKKVSQQRWGWAPRGYTPVQINSFNQDQRYQILPAYTVKGVLLARIYSRSTDTEFFNDFIKQLLQHCGRWPEPRSVLVMDNATFHCSDRLKELYEAAGVKLLYLPPYSPDFNPIEEFFAELKAYIKRHWNKYKGLIKDDFKEFLRHCIDAVGQSKKSTQGHFQHARLSIEEPCND